MRIQNYIETHAILDGVGDDGLAYTVEIKHEIQKITDLDENTSSDIVRRWAQLQDGRLLRINTATQQFTILENGVVISSGGDVQTD